MTFTFDIIIYIILFIAAGIGALIGLSRRERRAGVSAVTTLLAFCFALGLSTVLPKNAYTPILTTMCNSDLLTGSALTLFNSSEAVRAIYTILAGVLVGPTLFWVCFIVIKLLLLIPSLIIKHFVKKKEDDEYRNSGRSKGLGAFIGSISALLIVFAFIFPIVAYAGLGFDFVASADTDTLKRYSEEFDAGESYAIIEAGGVLSNGSSVYETCAKPMLKYMSSCRWRGQKLNYYTVMDSFMTAFDYVGNSFQVIVDGEAIYNASEEVSYFFDTVNRIIDDRYLCDLVSDFAAALTDAWENGDEILGITAPINDAGETDKVYIGIVYVLNGITEKKDALAAMQEDEINAEFEKYHKIMECTEKVVAPLYEETYSEDEFFSTLDAENLGTALETLDSTVLFKGAGEKIIDLIFSTDSVKSQFQQSEELCEKLKETLARHDGSFTTILKSAVKAAEIAEKFDSVIPSSGDVKEITEEQKEEIKAEIKEDIDELEKTMDDETKEMIKSSVSSSAVADAIADYRDSNPGADEELIKKVEEFFGLN